MIARDDHYATLSVSPDAENATIRTAYRELMRQYHPDVNRSAEADARAKAINEAYACLRDPARRAWHDRQRRAQPHHLRPATARPPRPAPPPTWAGPLTADQRARSGFEPSWGKAVGLGIATLITIITFTFTSATPPPETYVPQPGADKRAKGVGPASAPGERKLRLDDGPVHGSKP